MQTKISGVILTKDEGKNLFECIEIHKNYLDEIIIIDSSEGTQDKQYVFLVEKCKYYHMTIGQEGIEGFADLRNFGQRMASNEWIMHIDVDEIFSTGFFRDVDMILKDMDAQAFAFPRINLPFYERYPDHQIRFVNKNHVRWTGEVHEKIELSGHVHILNTYPIVHKEKANKLQMNLRWDAIKAGRNVLICILFRNSEFYLDKFLGCLGKLVDYGTKRKYDIDLCFIEGNSSDNTYLKLKQWLRLNKYKHTFDKLDINTDIERYQRLGIIRNMTLKLGLKNYHDYVLIIDSDTTFKEDLLHRLVEVMERNSGASVAAPMIYIENTEIFYDTLAFIKDGKHFDHLYPCHESVSVQYNGVIEMDSVGTCFLIKAGDINFNDVKDFNVQKCYKEMTGKPFIRFDGENDSEQIGFCQNIRKKGGKIYLDKRIVVYHADLPKYGLSWH